MVCVKINNDELFCNAHSIQLKKSIMEKTVFEVLLHQTKDALYVNEWNHFRSMAYMHGKLDKFSLSIIWKCQL